MTEWVECLCRKRGYHSVEKLRDATKKASNRVGYYRCKLSKLWHATNLDAKKAKAGKSRLANRSVTAKRKARRRRDRRKERQSGWE